MSDIKGNRVLVSVVTDDDGGTEVYWSRAEEDVTHNFDGSMQILKDGSTVSRFGTDDDVPFVVHVEDNRLRIALTEDMPPNYDRDKVVFDSSTDVPEWGGTA